MPLSFSSRTSVQSQAGLQQQLFAGRFWSRSLLPRGELRQLDELGRRSRAEHGMRSNTIETTADAARSDPSPGDGASRRRSDFGAAICGHRQLRRRCSSLPPRQEELWAMASAQLGRPTDRRAPARAAEERIR